LKYKGETIMEPKILAETGDQRRRLVELEAWHEADWDGATSTVITASLTQSGAEIRRMSNNEPPTNFWLDASVADAFCAAWTQFKADQEANKKAEEEQRQALIKEAYALAARHPEIKIETDGTASPGWWRVSIPTQAYRFMQPAYYPANLMEHVKICAEVLTEQKRVAGGDAA
jgi:hypothetical protein